MLQQPLASDVDVPVAEIAKPQRFLVSASGSLLPRRRKAGFATTCAIGTRISCRAACSDGAFPPSSRRSSTVRARAARRPQRFAAPSVAFGRRRAVGRARARARARRSARALARAEKLVHKGSAKILVFFLLVEVFGLVCYSYATATLNATGHVVHTVLSAMIIWIAYVTRQAAHDAYEIPDEHVACGLPDDCVCALCCTQCTLCQVARHVHDYEQTGWACRLTVDGDPPHGGRALREIWYDRPAAAEAASLREATVVSVAPVAVERVAPAADRRRRRRRRGRGGGRRRGRASDDIDAADAIPTAPVARPAPVPDELESDRVLEPQSDIAAALSSSAVLFVVCGRSNAAESGGGLRPWQRGF